MVETDLNKQIMSALAPWDPHRVENSVGPGTPDIEYIGGHIESKQMPRWPKRLKTVFKVPHYTPQQRSWHIGRCEAGGRCHVVIQVETTVLVFDARLAAQHLGIDWTKGDMLGYALLILNPWDRGRFRQFINQCNVDRQ
jgi:hypothetical protein